MINVTFLTACFLIVSINDNLGITNILLRKMTAILLDVGFGSLPPEVSQLPFVFVEPNTKLSLHYQCPLGKNVGVALQSVLKVVLLTTIPCCFL